MAKKKIDPLDVITEGDSVLPPSSLKLAIQAAREAGLYVGADSDFAGNSVKLYQSIGTKRTKTLQATDNDKLAALITDHLAKALSTKEPDEPSGEDTPTPVE